MKLIAVKSDPQLFVLTFQVRNISYCYKPQITHNTRQIELHDFIYSIFQLIPDFLAFFHYFPV